MKDTALMIETAKNFKEKPYFGLTGTNFNVWIMVACTTAMTLFALATRRGFIEEKGSQLKRETTRVVWQRQGASGFTEQTSSYFRCRLNDPSLIPPTTESEQLP